MDELTQSEAVMAFAGWLTCRDEVVSTGDAARMADLAALFNASQGFPEIRAGYAARIKPYPKD